MSRTEPKLLRSGKVRDIYDLDDRLLIVASDRISAYDRVLSDTVPGKGEALTQLSAWWFERTQGIFPNHFIQCEDARSMLVLRAERIDIEWVARSYLYGSMWRQYQTGTREFHGLTLPEGMMLAEELPRTILTPTTKADVGHDVDISRKHAVDRKLVTEDEWKTLEEATYTLYSYYKTEARKRGLLIPDFKVEYGRRGGELIQIDEPPTHDSARLWAQRYYRVGQQQEGHALDKEFLRVFLREAYGFTGEGMLPSLPASVVEEISKRCVGAYQVLKGDKVIEELGLRSVDEVIDELGEAK
ncbi:MAG: phosphoribosylaminoimidazolesuccinocarboxamide synthase [archaeon]